MLIQKLTYKDLTLLLEEIETRVERILSIIANAEPQFNTKKLIRDRINSLIDLLVLKYSIIDEIETRAELIPMDTINKMLEL